MKIKKSMIVLAVIVVAVLVASGAVPLLSLTNEISTNGVGYYERGVRGGSNDNGGGDLLDSTAYVTSWSGGGNSEKLVIQGKIYGSGLFDPALIRYWYVVSLSVDSSDVKINGVTGTVWTSTAVELPDGGIDTGHWIPLKVEVLTLTNPASGSAHVQLYGHIHWGLTSGATFLLAEDWGNLRSGVGSVKVQEDVVEEGTDAHFYVETAFSHSQLPGANPSDAGWFLQVFNPTGTKVWEKNVADEFSGTISWPVPAGSYSASSSNIYKIVLRNELINQDDDWLFTVGPGMLAQIPNKPSFKLIVGEEPFSKGDSLTVRISADKTYNPIMGFWVWVSYETSASTTTEYLYEKAWFPATQKTGGGYADVTFAWPDSGNARLEASTADSLNLNSGMTEMKFTVYGGEDNNVEPPVTDYSMLILGAFLLIVGLILYWKAPIPKPWNMVGALACVAAAVYLMYPFLMGG
jgi:hypothetical protein